MMTNHGSDPQAGLRAPRLGGHIVGKHRVEMDVSQMAINQGGLDGIHESAENVPRVFRFLMDIVRDEGRDHKAGTCHTFPRSLATHLLEDGYDIRTV